LGSYTDSGTKDSFNQSATYTILPETAIPDGYTTFFENMMQENQK
jgi:hypothetical protein